MRTTTTGKTARECLAALTLTVLSFGGCSGNDWSQEQPRDQGSDPGGDRDAEAAGDPPADDQPADSPGGSPSPEVPLPGGCDGFDHDGDGLVDAGCACTVATAQPCYPGDPAVAGVGACLLGLQTCESAGEFGTWGECVGAVLPADEACEDGVDNDCDGEVDEGCPTVVAVEVDLDGDCLTVRCPPEAPYPVGCDITMDGRDPRGCVASRPTDPEVYFQEGNACGAGHLSGRLFCSSETGAPLDEGNCAINKSERYYPDDRDGCPETEG